MYEDADEWKRTPELIEQSSSYITHLYDTLIGDVSGVLKTLTELRDERRATLEEVTGRYETTFQGLQKNRTSYGSKHTILLKALRESDKSRKESQKEAADSMGEHRLLVVQEEDIPIGVMRKVRDGLSPDQKRLRTYPPTLKKKEEIEGILIEYDSRIKTLKEEFKIYEKSMNTEILVLGTVITDFENLQKDVKGLKEKELSERRSRELRMRPVVDGETMEIREKFEKDESYFENMVKVEDEDLS